MLGGRSMTALGACVRLTSGREYLGSPIDEDGRDANEVRLDITIRIGFVIDTTPVTLADYTYVRTDLELSESRLPACVTWRDAIYYCNARSWAEGLDGCYEIYGDEVLWISNSGWRLPLSVEWEYACRAGARGPHYGPLAEIAWPSRHAVGEREPNDWGLYDTLGNVEEWVWDRSTDTLNSSQRPRGRGVVMGPEDAHILRGGPLDAPRAAHRGSALPHAHAGFRCVLSGVPASW